MELKKSPKADLENKRNYFVLLGLVIAISICLYSFESGTKINPTKSLGTMDNRSLTEDFTPITRPEEVKPELPPPPKVADLIIIVDNNTEIVEDLLIEDSEADQFTAINAVMQLNNSKETETDEATIFVSAEEMPEFPGGDLALLNYLNENIRYPTIAVENGIAGKVTVNFIVNKDGSISGATILRGVDQALDKEALRVVNSLPKWKPGKQAGKAVRVSYSVPIKFVLQ